jgi:hypothetical protein
MMIPGNRLQLQHFYSSFSYLHIEDFSTCFFFCFFLFLFFVFCLFFIIIWHYNNRTFHSTIRSVVPKLSGLFFFPRIFLKERKEEKREKSQTWDNSPWPLRIYGRCIRFFFVQWWEKRTKITVVCHSILYAVYDHSWFYIRLYIALVSV